MLVYIKSGREQVKKFSNGFYKPLPKLTKIMSIIKKGVRINHVEIFCTSPIYSRVIVMQLTNEATKTENVFKHELAPIPTPLFEDNDDKGKANPKKIESKMLARTTKSPELTVIDDFVIPWLLNWPTKTLVSDYIDNACTFIL